MDRSSLVQRQTVVTSGECEMWKYQVEASFIRHVNLNARPNIKPAFTSSLELKPQHWAATRIFAFLAGNLKL